MIYLLSPRSGGPFKQLHLVAKKLNELGYEAKHCYGLKDWLRLHFNRKDKIISVIPFFFVANQRNLILNIRGNYKKEKRLTNPLSYLYDRNLKLASKTIVPSHYLKKELQMNKAYVIPTSTTINNATHDQATLNPQAIQIATITNFDFRPKAQGISKLINIVNQLEIEKKLTINIYGGGRWLNHAKEQYELHNYKKFPVIFHGGFSNASHVLAGNDIFIYWSTFDNMPNVLIEATAAGLPIVVNRYAAYSEVLGEDNFLADSEHEFAQYLLQLINDPLLRQHYQKINRQRAKLFDIDKNIYKWIQVVKPE